MSGALHVLDPMLPVALVVGGLLLGLFVERVVLPRLQHIPTLTQWSWAEILLTSLYHMPLLWCTAAGVYGAVILLALPSTVQGLLEHTLEIGVIVSVTIFVARVAVGLLSRLAKRPAGEGSGTASPVIQYSRYLASLSTREGTVPSTSLFVNVTLFATVIRLVMLLLGLFLVLQNLGVSITPLITALGIGGLAVALALQETLSNLFAGLHIVASKQVRPGDYIKLNTGEEGYVTDVNWRNTVLTPLPANNIIIIPNNKFAAAILTNYTLPENKVWVSIEVGVSYASDLDKVEAVTIAVAKDILQEVTGGALDFDPVVRFHTFAESSINLTVRMLVSEFASQSPIKHAFIKRLSKRYKEEGIDIPFPIRTVYLKQSESET